jgi:hypothetical protein
MSGNVKLGRKTCAWQMSGASETQLTPTRAAASNTYARRGFDGSAPWSMIST